MKLPVRIGLAVGALVLVAVAIFMARPEPEPKYGGRTLSEWLTQMFSTYPRYDVEAVEALRAMGEPGVRWLATAVEEEDSRLTTKLLQYADKFPILGEVVPSTYWSRYFAAKALGEIGTNAILAVPALTRMQRDPELARIASAALVLVRNEPIKQIVNTYADHTSTNSSKAFGLLMELGPHAKSGIPTLLNELQSTNDRIRIQASILLAYVGMESPECVPVFTNLLSDPKRLIRVQAIEGLANCGPLAKSATPMVARLLNDPDELCQSSALIYFRRVVTPAELGVNLTAVQNLTNSPNQTVRTLAGQVLQQQAVKP